MLAILERIALVLGRQESMQDRQERYEQVWTILTGCDQEWMGSNVSFLATRSSFPR